MRSFTAPVPDVEPGQSVSAMVAKHASERPDGLALVCDDLRLSWRDFEDRVNSVANALNAMGIGPGDKVSLLARNSAQYVEVFIGTIRAGKKADFTILEQDPYEVGAENLREIPIWGTVFEGRPFPIKKLK